MASATGSRNVTTPWSRWKKRLAGEASLVTINGRDAILSFVATLHFKEVWILLMLSWYGVSYLSLRRRARAKTYSRSSIGNTTFMSDRITCGYCKLLKWVFIRVITYYRWTTPGVLIRFVGQEIFTQKITRKCKITEETHGYKSHSTLTHSSSKAISFINVHPTVPAI